VPRELTKAHEGGSVGDFKAKFGDELDLPKNKKLSEDLKKLEDDLHAKQGDLILLRSKKQGMISCTRIRSKNYKHKNLDSTQIQKNRTRKRINFAIQTRIIIL